MFVYLYGFISLVLIILYQIVILKDRISLIDTSVLLPRFLISFILGPILLSFYIVINIMKNIAVWTANNIKKELDSDREWLGLVSKKYKDIENISYVDFITMKSIIAKSSRANKIVNICKKVIDVKISLLAFIRNYYV